MGNHLQTGRRRQERQHRQEVLERVKNYVVNFEDLPEALRDDAEIALAAIKIEWWKGRFISRRLKNSREFALAALKVTAGMFLEYASDELRGDRKVVLEAVRRNGHALEFASEELRGDRKVVLTAVRCHGFALNHASEELRDDRKVVLTAVRQEGRILQYVSTKLCGDRDIVLEAVRQEGWLLEYASEELRADRDVVLVAVRQDGRLLEYASAELRADREVVLVAVRNNGTALRFASEDLSADRDVVLVAVRQDGYALGGASDELRADREIVLEAVRQNGYALGGASDELRADREIVLEAVRQNCYALRIASEELRGSREIVLAALSSTAGVSEVKGILDCVSNDRLINDPVVAGAFLQKGMRLSHGSELRERLEKVLLVVRTLPADFTLHISDEESYVEFCRWWERLVWQKIWLTLRLEPPGMEDTGRLLVELSGLHLELGQAKELHRCAPVIGAVLGFPSRDWKDLNSYYNWSSFTNTRLF